MRSGNGWRGFGGCRNFPIFVETTNQLFYETSFAGGRAVRLPDLCGRDTVETCRRPDQNPLAAEVDPAAPLPEYPRPTLVRSRWRNLNGLWNYSLTPAGAAAPGEAQGRILVPFPIESSLSGVQRGVTPQEALWYETTFEVPAAWRRGNDVLLHFGAVDWRAEVYVNDLLVGSHTGGYTPFSFDITPRFRPKGCRS